jgi:hypothetical protein
MSHQSLADTVLLAQDIAAQTASANVAGTTFDMQGWDGILYEFNIGAMASGATFNAIVNNSANSNMSGSTAVTNATFTSIANTANTNLYILDVWRPTNRYVATIAEPATANVTFGSVAIRYRRSGLLPPTQSASQVIKVAVN